MGVEKKELQEFIDSVNKGLEQNRFALLDVQDKIRALQEQNDILSNTRKEMLVRIMMASEQISMCDAKEQQAIEEEKKKNAIKLPSNVISLQESAQDTLKKIEGE